MRMKRTQWQEVVDVNLTGVYLCAQVLRNLASFLTSSVLPVNHFHVTPAMKLHFSNLIGLIVQQAAATVMMKRKKVTAS